MSIINGFDDVKLVIDSLSENEIRSIVAGRKYAVIQIDQAVIDADYRKEFGYTFNPKYLLGIHFDAYAFQIGNEDKSSGRTYLYIRIKLPLGFKNHKGVKVDYPSVDELVSMIKGKQLQFSTDFMEDHCSVEDVINRKMQEYVLNLRHDNEFYLYDQLFRIQIFLKKVSDEPSEMQFMEPVDVCGFDVNSKILMKLTEESNGFYNDAMILEYTSVSNRIKAQYFLSKFHSNRKWDADPICILNFRISAFVLPGNISEADASDYFQDKITWHINGDGQKEEKYLIDSIQIDSDICSDMSEFNEWIERFVDYIGLA